MTDRLLSKIHGRKNLKSKDKELCKPNAIEEFMDEKINWLESTLEVYEEALEQNDLDSIDKVIDEILENINSLEKIRQHRLDFEEVEPMNETLDRAYELLESLYEEKDGPDNSSDMINLWKIKEYALKKDKVNGYAGWVEKVDEMEKEYFENIEDIYNRANLRLENNLDTSNLTIEEVRDKFDSYKENYQPKINNSIEKVADDPELAEKLQREDEMIQLLELRNKVSTFSD